MERLEIAQLLGLDRDTVSKAMRVNIEEDGGFTTVPSELLFQGLRPGEILLASVFNEFGRELWSCAPFQQLPFDNARYLSEFITTMEI